MIDRRKFVASLSATAILPALSAALSSPVSDSPEPSAGGRARVNLNGEWERRIAGEFYDVITVPSSQHPVGNYQLRREFLLPRLSGGQRV